MANETGNRTTTTITIEDEFKAEVAAEGRLSGVSAWTVMLQVLAREGLAARKKARGQ